MARPKRWLVRTYSMWNCYRVYYTKPERIRGRWPDKSDKWRFTSFDASAVTVLLPEAFHLEPGEGPVELT